MDILYHRKKRITTQLNYNILNSFAMRNIPGHFRIFRDFLCGLLHRYLAIFVSFSIYFPQTDGNQNAKCLVALDDYSSAKTFQSVCLFAARHTD